MSGRVVTASPARRIAAGLLAGAFGLLAPGVAPLPAGAQEEDDGGYYATPPPVAVAPPQDTGSPNENYVKHTECVQRDLSRNISLQQKPWGQLYLRLDEVHRLMRNTTGSVGGGIEVAVIDTGVTATHPYFEGRVSGGGDYVKATPAGPGLEDCDGHGTEVAGIIAADTPEHIGFEGVAPDANIVSIRQSSQNYKPDDSPSAPTGGDQSGGDSGGDGRSGENGGGDQPNALRGPSGGETGPAQGGEGRTQDQEGSAGNLDTLAQAVVNAANRGVQVMNISINNCRQANGSIGSGEQALQAAVRYAVEERDVVVVSAAGNTTESCKQNTGDPDKPNTIVTPPWFADDVLSVAAIDATGSVADFSVHGPWVSVAAPGTDIISLDPAVGSDRLANMTIENGQQQFIQGTSFAAPYVSGLAALVRAKFPELSAREVMNRITSTAQHPAAPGGRDNFVGHGVIDPMAALTATVPEEEGIAPASAVALPSDMPPANNRDWTPMIVALAGAGGALAALAITLFVVHTIRRNRTPASRSAR
ncbi:membrane-anchored mycosin MYCP [Prauserella shujinwangii]|uniref:Membrane-anchored mycosin MYCP n=1 Tax=Prauserella shujinwangii TaxID=1453103 RepID=A0A2T0LLQ8_9PSEU|nr:type VII secretion-associated serine protease mycosin [Prauserella shujinwangii]PRX43974.1 membrane-anchored mycosin MYCP [Prauserella shujinwangii]